MKITTLEKKKRLYLMEIDETEKIYITEDTVVRFLLSRGKEVTAEELEDIRKFAQFSYGRNLALYYLSFKARTQKEVRDYLIAHEIQEDMIEQVVENLRLDKWLDDRQYAMAFIQSNSNSGDKGPYLVKQKLAQKGIAKGLIEEVLVEFDFSEVANRVAQKLLGKYEGTLPPKVLKNKIIQNLSNKGFSYEVAKAAYIHLEVEEDEESTQELLFRELDKQYPKYARKYEGYELKQRLVQTLARKGYDFSDISSALREYL